MLINEQTLEDLTVDDVYTFKVAMCDNEIDRMDEVFPLSSLEKMQSLFIGKTMIKDHMRRADNQVARIYATELVEPTSKTVEETGEIYTQLVARCYMLKSESNQDMIDQIRAGIKKEVSVGLSIGKAICSICGVDNAHDYCEHYWGQEYEGKKCYFKLEDPTDAYELSFVAVPAQPKAGTIKHYGAEYKSFEKQNSDQPSESETSLSLRMKNLDSFFNYTNNINREGKN